MSGERPGTSSTERSAPEPRNQGQDAATWGRDARRRLAVEIARSRAARARRRRAAVPAAVTLVLAGTVAIGIISGSRTSVDSDDAAGMPLVRPPGVTGPAGTLIPDGRTDVFAALTVYEDFRCTYCRSVERVLGPTIRRLADSGRVRVEYQIASFLDAKLGGLGSRRAANAAACAQAAGHFRAYHDALFAAQPGESDDAFADRSRLLGIADSVSGLRTTEFDRCVNESKYAPWVRAAQIRFDGSGVQGTPTVTLNDRPLTVLSHMGAPVSPEQFLAQVDRILGAPAPVGS